MKRTWCWLIEHWPSREAIGLVFFFSLLSASLYILIIQEAHKASSIIDTIRVIVPDLEPYVVASGAVSYGSAEGGAMIAEAFMKKREQKGREEGQAETNKKWQEWYEANKDHINGASPPPSREVVEKED